MNKVIPHKDYLGQTLEYGDPVLMTEMSNNGFTLGIVVGATPKNLRIIGRYDWSIDVIKLKGNCKDPQYVIKHPKLDNQVENMLQYADEKEFKQYLKELDEYAKSI